MNSTFHSNLNIINSDKYYLDYGTWDIGNLITWTLDFENISVIDNESARRKRFKLFPK